jgi:hypothetical protein
VSERDAGSFADAMLAHRGEIETALRGYDAPGVDRKAVAYFLLGCVSLDWDGLRLTGNRSYRKETEKRPDGEYVPAAEESVERSLEGIYWGSHTGPPYGGVSFTSFGDHSKERYGFPDLLWRLPNSVSSGRYPEELKPAIRSLISDSLDRSAAPIGRMMLALREGEKSTEELAQASQTKPEQAKRLLGVLATLDYVGEHEGRYRATVPVLTERDEAMIESLRRIGNQVMEGWLAANYGKMKSELQDLSFTRSGVAFEDGYTMIWHYVFGITNRKLVEAGLFADPYAPGRKFKGSIPAVYNLELQRPKMGP